MSDAGDYGRCPACGERHPGFVTHVFGADRVRCKRCKSWSRVEGGALEVESDDANVWLGVAGDTLELIDPELSTASERRLMLASRGLSGARLEAAAHALTVALDIFIGEPPEGWLTWKETRTPATYREVERVERELLVHRPGVAKEVLGAAGLALLAAFYIGHRSLWAFGAMFVVSMTALLATMKTGRWHLRPGAWELPGRWLGQRVRVSPEDVQAVHVTRVRVRNGDARYGIALTVAGARRPVVPEVLLSASEAHGLAAALEELAELAPRAAEGPRVRVDVGRGEVREMIEREEALDRRDRGDAREA